MEGTTIGAYRIVRQLGEGGMGTVYLAEHALLGRPAALKVLLPMYSANQEVVTRFFNEARAVTRVSDPGIVQLFDFGFHTDGSAYLVMELLDGESLDARLRRVGKLAPVEAVRMIRQCASSLANAHARGIIHRDLKPENLFVVGDPAVTGGERIKILDFGVAKLSGDGIAASKTRTGTLMGTPIYMSPEQCRGANDIDPRSDVYSLGCVLFAVLAGHPPFTFDNAGELIAAHLRERPPSLAHLVPAELDAIVQACLAKSPADRYPTMSALVEALDVVAATLWYAEPARTPVHLALTTVLPAVTTLGGATGETALVRPSRSWWRTLLAAAVVVAGGLFMMFHHSAEPVATAHAPAVDNVVLSDARAEPAAVVIDAAVAQDAAIDAGVAVAPLDASSVPAASIPPPRQPVRVHDHAHVQRPQHPAPVEEERRAPAAGSGAGSAVDRDD